MRRGILERDAELSVLTSAVREAADDWRNPGANKNAESDTTA